jgi:hypothetical protein
MDTRIIKIAFAVGSLAYAIYLFSKGYWGSGIGMVLVTTLAVLASLQSLRLLMVFVYLRQQRLDEARKWLDRVRPEQLWKRRRAYYAFLKGQSGGQVELGGGGTSPPQNAPSPGIARRMQTLGPEGHVEEGHQDGRGGHSESPAVSGPGPLINPKVISPLLTVVPVVCTAHTHRRDFLLKCLCLEVHPMRCLSNDAAIRGPIDNVP